MSSCRHSITSGRSLAGPSGSVNAAGFVQRLDIAHREGSMDATTEYLSDYACRLAYEDLSPEDYG